MSVQDTEGVQDGCSSIPPKTCSETLHEPEEHDDYDVKKKKKRNYWKKKRLSDPVTGEDDHAANSKTRDLSLSDPVTVKDPKAPLNPSTKTFSKDVIKIGKVKRNR